METPIFDFARRYGESDALRLHMPGHKGRPILGPEPLDLTEIDGADSLFEASGIILESERNAGSLFGADTFYSVEGSSLSIRAMLALTALYAASLGRHPLIVAARNAHRSFLTGVALLGLPIRWLPLSADDSYLSCRPSPVALEAFLSDMEERPTALWLTSPDYLGGMADIKAIAEVCHRFGVLLLVDNAHGAYLRFLPRSRHPLDLGADMAADSAHKTLPALTGCAYLHVARHAPALLRREARRALSLFASTSPSYLLLASLDRLNRELAETFPDALARFLPLVAAVRRRLEEAGYPTVGDEPLKLTLMPKAYGYTGAELAALLAARGVHPEFSDPDHLVLMLTPDTGEEGLSRLTDALLAIPKKAPISQKPPRISHPEQIMSIRDAMLSPSEELPLDAALGRVLASQAVACPPAVAPLVSGERIDRDALRALAYYGIRTVSCVINAPAVRSSKASPPSMQT